VRLSPLLAALLMSGCLTDAVLGDRAADAAADDAAASFPDAFAPDAALAPDAFEAPDVFEPDAEASPDAHIVSSGETYQLSYYGPPDTQCIDALAGREAQFSMLTSGDCGLLAGPVALTRVSTRSWTLSGQLMQDNFGRASVRLSTSIFPDQPEEVLVSTLYFTGSGPFGTQRGQGIIAVDRNTETAQSIEGFVGVELAQPDFSGSCFLTFGMRLEH